MTWGPAQPSIHLMVCYLQLFDMLFESCVPIWWKHGLDVTVMIWTGSSVGE